MSAKLLRCASYSRMPWKNGAGVTLEIARDTSGSQSGFGWRFSVADVEVPGDFSAFAGYQRIITVLEGMGMTLTVNGQRSRLLQPLDPFAFAGEAVVSCELPEGPVRDFNLIYDPARFQARLQWQTISNKVSLYTSAAVILILSAGDSLTVETGTESAQLGVQDSFLIEQAGGLKVLRLASSSTAACCLVELTPV
jgi:environmental stress-induced protein Ves